MTPTIRPNVRRLTSPGGAQHTARPIYRVTLQSPSLSPARPAVWARRALTLAIQSLVLLAAGAWMYAFLCLITTGCH